MSSTSLGVASTAKRPQTPYAPPARVSLLDGEGALTHQLEEVLLAVFLKYATDTHGNACPSGGPGSKKDRIKVGDPRVGAYTLKEGGLESFGRDTNGQALPQEQVRGRRVD